MKKLLSLLAFSTLGFCAAPDCTYSYRLTNIAGESTDAQVSYFISSGQVATIAINNINSGCSAWAFSYDASGFSAVNISLQSAPNIGSIAPFPGVFGTFAGSTVSGSNPSTATSSSLFTATGYYPYIRISLNSSTGTGGINITLNGWKSPAYISANSGGGGGGGVTNFPSSLFSVSGTTASYATGQTPNLVLRTGTGTVSFSPLTISDLPTAIPNANLANSSTAVNGQACTLGSACTSVQYGVAGQFGYYANNGQVLGPHTLVYSDISSALSSGYNALTAQIVLTNSTYSASGSAQTTTLASNATAGASSITTSSGIDFAPNQGIYIAGAGPSTGVGGTITYSSGLTATGTGTCYLTATNGGGQGAVGTLAITSGTPATTLTVIASGLGYTSAPTTWSATAGFTTTTVTCSGTVTTTGGNFTTATNYIGTIGSGYTSGSTTIPISPNTSTSVTTGAVVQHDDSAALNNAIIALENTGGDIFMPNGTYRMNNCWATGTNNSVITFPNIPATGDPSELAAITVRGGNSLFGNLVLPSGQIGTIIQTNCPSGSLINVPASVGGNGWLAFTPEFTSITFSSYQNPGVTMLDLSKMNQSKVYDVQFLVGATGSIPNQPFNPNGQAFINSGPNNLDVNIVRKVLAYGYYNALTLGAHTFGSEIYTFWDWNCIVVNNSGDHPVTLETIDAERCGRVFSPNGVGQQSYLDVMHLDTELTTDQWPGTMIACYDPNNNFTGLIRYGNNTANPWTQTGCGQLNHATYPSFIEGGLNVQSNGNALTTSSAVNCGAGLACSVSLVNSREVFKIENPSAIGFNNTISVNANAGTGASASVSGGQTSGTITLITGTSPSSGTQASVSYQYTSGTYGAPKGCLMFPTNANSAGIMNLIYTSSPSTTGWTFSATSALAASTTYTFTYSCGQPGGN